MKSESGELQALAGQFLLVLQNERNASAHTIRAYRREIAGFADHLAELLGAQASIRTVDHLHIRGTLAQPVAMVL